MRYLIVEGITDISFVKYICVQNGITKKFDDFTKSRNQSGKDLHKPQDSFMYKFYKEYKDTQLWDLSKDEFQPIINFVLEIFKK